MKKLTCEIVTDVTNEGTPYHPSFWAEIKLSFDNNSSILYLQYEDDFWGIYDQSVIEVLSKVGISSDNENIEKYTAIVEEVVNDCKPKKIDFADLINDYLNDEVEKVANCLHRGCHNDSILQVYCSVNSDKTYVMICKDDKLDVYITFDSYVDYVDFLKSDEIWDDQASSLADFRITYNVEQYINGNYKRANEYNLIN
jgi:hypothetical protein